MTLPRFTLPKLPRVQVGVQVNDPRFTARAALGVLLLLNLIATVFAFFPPGGSPEDLAREADELRARMMQTQQRVNRTRAIAEKVERARKEGDAFLTQYTMDRRTTFSSIVSELAKASTDAGLKGRECTWQLEPTEGSETLSQMTIQCGYEGAYANLNKFVNLLDRSPRFLIVEQLVASPQQTGPNLNISVKLDTFVRSLPGAAPAATVATPTEPAAGGSQ